MQADGDVHGPRDHVSPTLRMVLLQLLAAGKPVAGLFPTNRPGFEMLPEAWMSYLAVDDVDKRVAVAHKAGAKLMKPVFDVPGVGRIAILMEPGGAGVGWMTPVAD